MQVYVECAECGFRFTGQSLTGPKDKIIKIHSYTCRCEKGQPQEHPEGGELCQHQKAFGPKE